MFGTSEPDVYFYGKTLEKIGRERYKITSGGFTTCVQPTPRWQLTSGTVLLNLEKHAILTNSLFRVKGVPVLYLPIFYYPVNKEDRATGFLIPTYGTSTVRGQTLSNAFFWAISRSQDATLLHDWYSTTGQGMGGEYRYLASPGSDRPDPLLQPARARGGVHRRQRGDRDHAGAPQLRGARDDVAAARARGSGRAAGLTTSRTSRSSRPTTRTSTTRRAARASTAARSPAPSAAWNLSGAFDRNETFYGTTQSTVRGGTPKVSAQRSDKPMFGSPAYFSMAVEAVNVHGPAQDLDIQRRQRAFAVRHLSARAPAVHEVAVPHGLDHCRGPVHVLDRAEGPEGDVAQPRRPDQPQLLRPGGAGERPDLQPDLEPARQQLRREDQALHRAVPSTSSGSRRSTTSPSS